MAFTLHLEYDENVYGMPLDPDDEMFFQQDGTNYSLTMKVGDYLGLGGTMESLHATDDKGNDIPVIISVTVGIFTNPVTESQMIGEHAALLSKTSRDWAAAQPTERDYTETDEFCPKCGRERGQSHARSDCNGPHDD